MSDHPFYTKQVRPKNRHGDLLVAIGSKSFLEFDCWVDAQLARLVDRWSHMASPRAKRAARDKRGRRG